MLDLLFFLRQHVKKEKRPNSPRPTRSLPDLPDRASTLPLMGSRESLCTDARRPIDWLTKMVFECGRWLGFQ